MKNAFILTMLVFLGGAALYVVSRQSHTGAGHQVVCTAEALACPDGSYVGRSGPACAFAACPAETALEGVLQKQGEGYRLLMAAPEGTSTQEVSYSLPLVVKDTAAAEQLLGARVSLTGSFTDGNTLRVAGMTKLTEDTTHLTLGVGESGFVNGVKIRVNSVTQDSRCPSDVECIQAGTVVANVTLQSDTDTETRVLTLGADAVGFDSYQVHLAQVTPVPVSTAPITTAEYRLTFSVTSNQ